MNNISSILNDFKLYGYSYVELPSDLYISLVEITDRFYNFTSDLRYEVLANEESGILGYVPSENDLQKIDISNFNGNRKRGYSSFDFIGDNSALLGTNPILKSNNWIESERDFQIKANILYRTITKIANKISFDILNSFITIETNIFESNTCLSIMRLLNYSRSEIESISKEHTDYEFITFIVSNQDGLEVKDSFGNWNKVKMVRNKAVILIGDMLEVLSNGKLKSSMHRVRNSNYNRQSTIYFQGLPLNYPINYNKNGIVINCDFGHHILPLLLSGAIHLQDKKKEISSIMNLKLISSNPFKK